MAKNGVADPFEQLEGLPTIYAITPTHTRPLQKAELTRYFGHQEYGLSNYLLISSLFYTRISQTFLLVPNFHWIVVEDSEEKTALVTNLLARSGLTYTHLNAVTPKEWKLLLEVIINLSI